MESSRLDVLVVVSPLSVDLVGDAAPTGWQVETAQRPVEFEDRYGEDPPDAVLLDIECEELGAWLEAIRRAGLCGRTPILLGRVPEGASEELIDRAMESGFAELVLDADGPEGLQTRLATGRWRSRHRRLSEALAHQMAAAQHLARCGSWNLDPGADEIHLSDEASRVLGVGELGGTMSIEEFLKQVPPADHGQVESWMAELLSGSPPTQLRHGLWHPDDGERIVLHRAEPVLDDLGDVISLTGVVLDITEQQRRVQKLVYETHHDDLTGLANRRELEERLEEAVATAHSHQRLVGVLFLDLNRFKKINDSLGHRAGDRLLLDLSERLREAMVDAQQQASAGARAEVCLARIGGDEFAVLLPEMDDGAQAVEIGSRILRRLEAPFDIYGQEVFVSARIGIALSPIDDLGADSLIKRAETAMYHAKEHGRGLQLYSSSMNSMSRERLSLETSFRRALERDELEVHYQPKNDARTRRIVGMEALVRWRHPEIGLIGPDRFIPIAEETGLIVPMGEWVLETACRQNKAWQDAGLPPIRQSVNLSGRQFAQPGLAARLASIVHSAGLETRWVELELTESILMQSTQTAIQTLKELKEVGIGLSIDDFGTGYSSLSYLKDFPIDILKVDRSFVSQMLTDEGSRALTKAIVSIAHSLDLQVVAEGVETEEQLAALRDEGCEVVQGYLFSPPVPADRATELLEQDTLSLVP